MSAGEKHSVELKFTNDKKYVIIKLQKINNTNKKRGKEDEKENQKNVRRNVDHTGCSIISTCDNRHIDSSIRHIHGIADNAYVGDSISFSGNHNTTNHKGVEGMLSMLIGLYVFYLGLFQMDNPLLTVCGIYLMLKWASEM